jgi:hypothetical protein
MDSGRFKFEGNRGIEGEDGRGDSNGRRPPWPRTETSCSPIVARCNTMLSRGYIMCEVGKKMDQFPIP